MNALHNVWQIVFTSYICCLLQRKNRGSISGPQTVLKAITECADDARNITVNVDSGDCERSDVDNFRDLSSHGDHKYCRIETADRETALSDPPVELVLEDCIVKTESTWPLLSESSVCCVGTESEPSHELLSQSYTSTKSYSSVCSSSDDTCISKSDLSHSPSVVTMQLLDASSLTQCCMSDLDVAHTEDVSLASSATSGVSDSTTDSKSKELCDTGAGVADNCEVVDLTDGRSVELECQCGTHYSDPSDKLHVVECERCHSHQHAVCVNYDLTDPVRGNYLCPHCHVIEVSDVPDPHTHLSSL